MRYYETLATVIPLLYVAIVLEGRLRGTIIDANTKWTDIDPFEVVSRATARLFVLVGLPVLEAGVLIGIAHGKEYSALNASIPAILVVVGLLLVCPPIWKELEPLIPNRYHVAVKRALEGFLASLTFVSAGMGVFGIFPS